MKREPNPPGPPRAPGVAGRLALASLVAAATFSSAACYRLPPPDTGSDGRPEAESGENRPADRSGEPEATTRPAPPPLSEGARMETDRLERLGPIYTPYEEGPRLVWDEVAQRAVVEILAPVIEREDLSVTTRALLWVLVGADGRVVDAVVQTTSSNDAFDRAALELAEQLLFEPAGTNGKPVPVWVIREMSLLMQ